MGHLVNPLLYRLNYSAFWNGSLITGSKFDSYINVFSVYFSNFARGYFKNYDWVDKYFLFVSSLKFFFINSSIFVYVDFWHHANFYNKIAVAFETTFHLFSIALKKRLFKICKRFKNKSTLNYFAWRKYFIFRKHLTFFKKKINYKSFARNFIGKTLKFSKNKIRKPLHKKIFGNSNFSKNKFRVNGDYLTLPIKILKVKTSNEHYLITKGVKRGVIYERSLLMIYFKYCRKFSYTLTFAGVNCFYKFSKIKSLPKNLDFSYWLMFLEYEFNTTRRGFGIIYMTIFIMLLLRKRYQPILDEILRLKAIKEAELEFVRVWGFAIFAQKHLSFKKKNVFLPKFKNLNSNFLSFFNFTMLKKKKLKKYFFWAKKTKYRFSSKKFSNFLVFNTNFVKKTQFNFFKFIRKKRKLNNRFSLKMNWWKKVYSRFLEKKKFYKRKRLFKKLLRIGRNKKPLFAYFRLKTKKNLVKKLKSFSSNIRFKKLLNKIYLKKKPVKPLKLKNFFKSKKPLIYSVRFKSKKRNIKFYKNWIPKKYYKLRWKNRIFFNFKKDHSIKKFFLYKKPLFFKKKLRFRKSSRWIKIIALRRARKKKKRAKKLAHAISKHPNEKAYYDYIAKKKLFQKLFKKIITRVQTDFIKRDKNFFYYDIFAEETMDLTERALDFWPPRRSKLFKIRPANKLKFFNKKFRLLLKYFFVFNKLYTVKRNFVRHVSVVTNFWSKINVCFFIRAAYSFHVNADLIGDFLVLWFMKKKFVIKEILGTLLNYLNKGFAKKGIGGYAILMKGRFTRKDRAMYSWKKLGPMPLSHRIATVDYCNRWVPLKYSQCAFKIYLLKSDYGYIRKQHRNVRKKNALKNYSLPTVINTEAKIMEDARNKFMGIQRIHSYEDHVEFAKKFGSGPIKDGKKVKC